MFFAMKENTHVYLNMTNKPWYAWSVFCRLVKKKERYYMTSSHIKDEVKLIKLSSNHGHVIRVT